MNHMSQRGGKPQTDRASRHGEHGLNENSTPMAREKMDDQGSPRVATERVARHEGSGKEQKAGKHSGSATDPDPDWVERIGPVPDFFIWSKSYSIGF